MSQSYLYLICIASDDGKVTGPVKIGITRSLSSRLKSVQTGSFCPLKYYDVWVFPKDVLKGLECFIHEYNKEKRLCGEWFDVEPEHMRQIIELMLNSMRVSVEGSGKPIRYGLLQNDVPYPLGAPK